MSHVCPHCDVTVPSDTPVGLDALIECLRATLTEARTSAPPLPTPTKETADG